MLRKLGIVAGLSVVAVAMSGQPYEAANPNKQGAKQSQPAVISSDGNNKQHSSQTDQPKPSGNPPAGDAPVERPHWWAKSDWWIVIIAGLTGCMIGWQSWETRKAAQAGAAQAETAARSARAFINKERSRMFLAYKITPQFEVTVTAVNRGQSPAHVTYKFIGCELLKLTESLPEVPRYTDRGEPPEDYVWDEWVPPGKPISVGSYDAGYISTVGNPELYKMVLGREMLVWFYGIIIYQDSVSEDEHWLKFCYRCHPFESGNHYLVEAGPTAYRGEK